MPRYLLNSTQRPRFSRPNPFSPAAENLWVYSPMLEGGAVREWMLGHMAVPSANVRLEPTGRGDFCGVFNGSNTFLDYPTTNANRIDVDDITICCWLWLNSTALQNIMEKGSDLDNTVSYGLGITSGGFLSMAQGNDFTGTSTFAPSTNQWYHVAVSRNKRLLKIRYRINGGLLYDSSFTYTKTPIVSSKTLTIGTRGVATIGSASGRGLHFNGKLSDLRIYLGEVPDGVVWSCYAPTQRDGLHQRWRRTCDLIGVFDMPLNNRIAMSVP